MSNAIKYSDTGTITVTTGRSKGTVWIQFHDEGRGFTCRPEELFKRYFRENENIPGYGLGLSQAKLMIELLDGNIKAEKNDGPPASSNIIVCSGIASCTFHCLLQAVNNRSSIVIAIQNKTPAVTVSIASSVPSVIQIPPLYCCLKVIWTIIPLASFAILPRKTARELM